MKHSFRKVCAALLAVLIFTPRLSALAAEPVRIPSSVYRLNVPDRPDSVELSTYAENDGVLAYLDGDYSLFFAQAVDFAAVDWVDGLEIIELDADNSAVTSKEGHKWQQHAVIARVDGVTTSYTNAGVPRAVWTTSQEDLFSTGMEDAWTTIYWRSEIIKSSCGGYIMTWYIGNITVSYPYGEEIRSISVDYRNNKRNTLYGYTITYAVSDNEVYSIRYDDCDRWVRAYYNNGTRTLEYTCDPERGKWIWADVETGRESRQRGLLKPSSFESPRTR